MAISYEEALATLQSMFSDQGYTAQQLDAVLRHHGGHMEHTVETLLIHGEGTPDELMQKLPSLPVGGSAAANNNGGGGNNASGGNAAHDIDADEELARQLAAEDEQPRGRSSRQNTRGTTQSSEGVRGMASVMGANLRTAAAPTRTPVEPAVAAAPSTPAGKKGRGTPTVLPSDFLRIPGRKYPSASTTATSNAISDPIASAAGPGGMGQMMTDEQMARMLQDELFQEELRNNPEFSHLAGRRNPSARSAGYPGDRRTAGAGGGQTTGRSTYGGAGGGGTDFSDKLSELGDKAKSRFQDFVASWNDPNAQANRRALFGGGGAQNTTANRGNERRGLLSNDLNMDEDEEELDFVGGNSDRAVEMNDVGGSGAKINWSGDKKKD